MNIPLLTRANIAIKAAMGIFSDQSLQQAGGLIAGMLGSGGAPPTRGTLGFLQSYSTMPWVRGIMGKIAFAVASTEWKLLAVKGPRDLRARRDKRIQQAGYTIRKQLLSAKQKAGELKEIEEHPFLDLMNNANSFHTGLSLRKLTQVYLDLSGDCFWLKQRNPVGAPIAAWPIPPHWILRVPTKDSPFYELGTAGQRFIVPDTEMLWMSDPNPTNPYGRGSGHMTAVGDELETDEYAAKMAKQVFFNRARPELLIMPKEGALEPEEVNRLEQKWTAATQGFWRAFRPFFIRRAVEVKVFDQDFNAVQLGPLRKQQRDTVMQVFGMPPELLGILESSNRATIEAAEYLFNEYVVIPRLEFLRAQLQSRMIPEYDERLILDYESPSKIDKKLQLDTLKVMPWIVTINEARELAGFDELEEGGDMHMIPMSVSPTEEIVEPEPDDADLADRDDDEDDDNPRRRYLRPLSIKELRRLRTIVSKIHANAQRG